MKGSILVRGVEEVIDAKNLEKRLASGEKLRVKYGIDPTAPDIHIGHAVPLRKLREFQDLGHQAILIIGDYTARIGDPSGKNKIRPILTAKQVEENVKTYLRQVGKIIDIKRAEIVYNSKWFSKMSFQDILSLMSKFTLAQIVERDDFSKRFKGGIDIGMHEMLYPIMQAYDSVMVKAGVELGGTDQKFNMMTARDLQRKMDQKPQDVLCVSILAGLNGKEKMSKSLGNAIGVCDAPNEMFGKAMSIPDEIMMQYFVLATSLSQSGISMIEKELAEGANPRDIKARLAYMIVEEYHGRNAAEEANKYFDETFKQKKTPDEMPEVGIAKGVYDAVDLLIEIGAAGSKSESRRLIDQGGVRIDDKIISDINGKIEVNDGMIVKVGKRKFFRIRME